VSKGAGDQPRLPAGVAAWLEETLGADWTIQRLRSLDATSATVLAVEVECGGTRRPLVLRLQDRAWFTDEPEALAREVAALTMLERTDIPAPRLIGWSERDPAAVLMTLVPGAPELMLPDPGAVRALLGRLHALPTDGLSPWSYRGYHEGADLVRPAWWRDAATWERAVRQTESARPAASPVVIHRDFHPGNILWVDGRLTGIVDWVGACLGPAPFDASHLRMNLAVLHGPDGPDRVISGDPAWDIEAAFGFLDWASTKATDAWDGPWPHISADVARVRFEAFISEALARLG
jgi:aminoglycoside phosphotransferase (APT) family kinase protein